MQCLNDLGGGNYQVANPQPTYLADCVNVVVQATDLQPEFFLITPAEGAQISAGILVCWAIAFGVKWAIRALNIEEKEE